MKHSEQAYPQGLLRISLDGNTDLSVRSACSILLKNWIDYHWNASSEKFKEPIASEETKIYVRQNLPQGLSVSQRGVRSLLSAALAIVASFDWPEVWPELIPSLLQALDSSDINTVDGSLRTLKEFTQDVTDTNAPEILVQILPKLLNVMMNPTSHAVSISRSIQILTSLTSICGDIKAEKLDQNHFKSILNVFAQCVHKNIETDDDWAVKVLHIEMITKIQI